MIIKSIVNFIIDVAKAIIGAVVEIVPMFIYALPNLFLVVKFRFELALGLIWDGFFAPTIFDFLPIHYYHVYLILILPIAYILKKYIFN